LQVVAVKASPPPEIERVIPEAVDPNVTTQTITIKGERACGRAFFNTTPTAASPNSLTAMILTAPVTLVSGPTKINDDEVQIVVNTTGATPGTKIKFVIINPDGQQSKGHFKIK
jgi:hypothetical protein